MKKNVIKSSILLASLFLGFTACKSDDTESSAPIAEDTNFLLALSLPATELYPFHIVDDIESGTANIVDSQEIPGLPNNVVVAGKDGFIYLNSKSKLTKYEVDEEGILVDLGAVKNTGISGGPVSEFLSDNRLLVSTGARAADGGVFEYQIINTDDMSQESKGTITLPIKEGDKSAPSLYILKEGKVFVPYFNTNSKWAGYDYASVAIYDATTMEYEKVITTDKASGLGFSVVSSHAFTENGDLYLTSTNTDYWGANETIPSGIVRIKAGQDDFDDYFFNLSEKFGGNHTAGMSYAGNNKAVVQVFRDDLIEKYADYQGSFVIEYHSVDLITKETTKLDIPLSKWPRNMIEAIGDGKVAIIGNTESEGNNVYIYDSVSNTVKKGLAYKGTETISAILSFK